MFRTLSPGRLNPEALKGIASSRRASIRRPMFWKPPFPCSSLPERRTSRLLGTITNYSPSRGCARTRYSTTRGASWNVQLSQGRSSSSSVFNTACIRDCARYGSKMNVICGDLFFSYSSIYETFATDPVQFVVTVNQRSARPVSAGLNAD